MAAKRRSLKTILIMKIIESIVTCYDIFTLPIYFLLQRPWQYWKTIKLSKLEDEKDPYSSYVRCTMPEQQIDIGDGETIVELLDHAYKKHGDKNMYGTREVLSIEEQTQKDGKVFKKYDLGDYHWMTFNEANKKTANLCHSLLAIGAKPKEFIIIFAETRVEWFLTAQACFRINIPVVTLYATLSEEAIIHGINETQVTHLITSHDLLPKLKKIIPSLPKVEKIVVMKGFTETDLSGFPEKIEVISFEQFENLGRENKTVSMPTPPKPDDIAIVMYTSGSTGIPKGVVISHKNVVISVINLTKFGTKIQPDDVAIGYLPLAHSLEINTETWMSCAGIPVGYSSPLTFSDNSTAVKKGCKGDIAILKPSGFAAVPLILDKIRKGIIEVVESKGELASAFFDFAINYSNYWYKRGFNSPILDRIAFAKIRSLLGGRIRAICVGGAPLSEDTSDFIRATLGAQIMQGYGMTETSSCATLMDFWNRETGKVGAPLCNSKIRFVDWEEGGYRATDTPNPRGEIVVGGDFVSLGYFNRPELTNEVFKEENGEKWFYSGDIGEMLPDGQLKIIDRKKDLVKLQFGEYIPLGKVESTINTCNMINSVCVFGNGFHNFLIALIEPNKNAIIQIAESLGKNNLSWKDMCLDKQITEIVSKKIKDHCRTMKLYRYEIPEKFRLIPDEWTPDTGLVTAAFKIRRKMIEQFYKNDIDTLYESQEKKEGF